MWPIAIVWLVAGDLAAASPKPPTKSALETLLRQLASGPRSIEDVIDRRRGVRMIDEVTSIHFCGAKLLEELPVLVGIRELEGGARNYEAADEFFARERKRAYRERCQGEGANATPR